MNGGLTVYFFIQMSFEFSTVRLPKLFNIKSGTIQRHLLWARESRLPASDHRNVTSTLPLEMMQVAHSAFKADLH